MPLYATILTLFPEMFPGTLDYALSGRALKNKLWNYRAVNLHEFSPRGDGRVDDRPYGGGAGMIIRADIIDTALMQYCGDVGEVRSQNIIYFTPRGQEFTSKMAQHYAEESQIFLVAGRYEGIDQRVIDKWQMQEISVGPYILSGGELAAQIFLDAVIRLLPDVVGNPDSLKEESFSQDFYQEYPHYTRPQNWQGRVVPETLLQGNHQEIIAWRKRNSLLKKLVGSQEEKNMDKIDKIDDKTNEKL